MVKMTIIARKLHEPVARLMPAKGAAAARADAGSPQSILDWLKSRLLPAHARRSAEEIDAAIEE